VSIRARILALVGGFAAMALIVTALGLQTIADYNRTLRDYDHAYENVWRAERLNHIVSNVVLETRGLYIARSDDELNGFIVSLDKNLDTLQTCLDDWKAHLTPEEAGRLKPIEQDVRDFIAVRRQVAALGRDRKLEDAHTLSTGNRPIRIAFQNKLDALVLKTVAELDAAKAKTAKFDHDRAIAFLVTCIAGILIMAFAALWLVTQFVTRPLRELAAAIVSTSKGDYSKPLPAGDGKTEIDDVWKALAVLKAHAIEAEALRRAEHERERSLREIMLD
jgi:methyl-accepting chemotaxis protein